MIMNVVLLLVVAISFSSITANTTPPKTKLLLISFDGFPAYYLKDYSLPTFKTFRSNGVTVPFVRNNFPTKTFPCHVTISTGLFSESHGIVSNRFYDPDINDTFSIKSDKVKMDRRWWKNGEPIWITAENQGRKTGVYFWPGSENSYDGKYPSFYMIYNQSIPFEERVDKIVNLLSKESYDFGVMYFNEPDTTGHTYGPNSQKMKSALERVDNLLRYILNRLTSAKIDSITNIIITSDHGMVETPPSKYLNLTEDLNYGLIKRTLSSHAILLADAEEGRSSELYQHLLQLSRKFGHMTVYNKTSIPKEFHWKNNKRVPEITVVADEGYKIITKVKEKRLSNGDHGYIPVPSHKMYPMFIARGPAFKRGKVLPSFNQEDLYVLMSNILNINPRPHNGSFERVKPLLSESWSIKPFQLVMSFNLFGITVFNLLY